MFSVFVQVWGPVDSTACAYDWITVGMIETESIDIDFLKEKALDIINSKESRPFMNAARLKIMHGDKTEMKVTMTDLW